MTLDGTDPRIISANKIKPSAPLELVVDDPSSYHLIYCATRKFLVEDLSSDYRGVIGEGDIMMVGPGDSVKITPQDPKAIHIHFDMFPEDDTRTRPPLDTWYDFPRPIHLFIGHNKPLVENIRYSHHDYKKGEGLEYVRNSRLRLALAIMSARSYKNDSVKLQPFPVPSVMSPREHDVKDLHMLSQALFLMHHQLIDITVEKIREHLGVSLPTLNKLFSRHFGYTPGKWLNRLRMRRAQELLYFYPRATEEDLADKIGYTDKRNFLRSFKEYSGMTLEGYRVENGFDIEPPDAP